MSPLPSWILLFASLAAACSVDLRQRRIPNWVVLATLAFGLTLQAVNASGHGLFAYPAGGAGVSSALLAVAAMTLAGIVLWRFGMFGAGDAKMLGALAAFFGFSGVLPLLLTTLACGGLLGLGAMAAHHACTARTRTAGGFVALGRVPYSLAIAAASLILAFAEAAGLQLW